jgi:alpha-ketoglutarate-dependent taurine dioxygenase
MRDGQGEAGVATISTPSWLSGCQLVTAHEATLAAVQWIESQRQWLSTTLSRVGAVLLRGFEFISVEDFEKIATIVGGGPPQPYENRSTPRSRVKGNVFTSTEYPASENIPLHNENSYSSSWPRQILFLCMQPAARGGETPIADSRLVYAAISPSIRTSFEKNGVLYIRNYGDMGLAWQETFQTSCRADVEEYCRSHNIRCEWRMQDRLRTWQVLPAVRHHPGTGERVWFNQAHLFHISNLRHLARQILDEFGEDRVPRHARFGDGSKIDASCLDGVRAAYERHAVNVAWKKNDLLILDNMLWAHGRRAFLGSRRVLVAMTQRMQGGSEDGEVPP